MMKPEGYVRFKECCSPAQEKHHLPGSVMMRDKFGYCKRMGMKLVQEVLRTTVDPQGNFIQQWNKGVLILCVFALALDPLYFYIPQVDLTNKCLELDQKMRWSACSLRTLVDLLYLFHMALKFRTAFIPAHDPPSKDHDYVSSGSDDDLLVKDSYKIAHRYLHSYLLVDILSILPFPQTMLWQISKLDSSTAYITKEALKLIIFGQSIPRIIRIYPIYKQYKSNSGFLAQTAWAGAAFNLFLYMLASHVAGALWYLVSVERQDSCWHEAWTKWNLACELNPALNGTACIDPNYLYCGSRRNGFVIEARNKWCPLTNLSDDTTEQTFNFGIFLDALQSRIVESNRFRKKLFYCFWWGLRNLSTLGQELKTSTFTGEIVFAIGLSVSGLVLFALLIGNMQTYLQSISGRVEKTRVRRGDAEQWMSQRKLPEAIKEKVRKYEKCKWQLTKGVEEEDLIKKMPSGLRREIYRHLWEKTFVKPLTKFPMFKEMGQHLNDEMFDLLKPVVFPKNATIIEEGAPVDEILFITKGRMKTAHRIKGGGSYFKPELKVGDLFGEELVTWACDRNRTSNELPKSNRKVVTKTQLEAYALTAEDFKSIASKFLSSIDTKRVEQAVRFLSVDWRTRSTSTIQKAWRRYKEMKLEKDLHQAEQSHGH